MCQPSARCVIGRISLPPGFFRRTTNPMGSPAASWSESAFERGNDFIRRRERPAARFAPWRVRFRREQIGQRQPEGRLDGRRAATGVAFHKGRAAVVSRASGRPTLALLPPAGQLGEKDFQGRHCSPPLAVFDCRVSQACSSAIGDRTVFRLPPPARTQGMRPSLVSCLSRRGLMPRAFAASRSRGARGPVGPLPNTDHQRIEEWIGAW